MSTQGSCHWHRLNNEYEFTYNTERCLSVLSTRCFRFSQRDQPFACRFVVLFGLSWCNDRSPPRVLVLYSLYGTFVRWHFGGRCRPTPKLHLYSLCAEHLVGIVTVLSCTFCSAELIGLSNCPVPRLLFSCLALPCFHPTTQNSQNPKSSRPSFPPFI